MLPNKCPFEADPTIHGHPGVEDLYIHDDATATSEARGVASQRLPASKTDIRLLRFVSHQWVVTAHPDPGGHQQQVLQCLRRICGNIAVTKDAASQLLEEVNKHSPITSEPKSAFFFFAGLGQHPAR